MLSETAGLRLVGFLLELPITPVSGGMLSPLRNDVLFRERRSPGGERWRRYSYRTGTQLTPDDAPLANGFFERTVEFGFLEDYVVVLAQRQISVMRLIADHLAPLTHPRLRRHEFLVSQLVVDATRNPAEYALSSVHAEAAGEGMDLSKVVLFGRDLASTNILRLLLEQSVVPYSCGLRRRPTMHEEEGAIDAGAEVVRVHARGLISFARRGSIGYRDLEVALRFLTTHYRRPLSPISAR